MQNLPGDVAARTPNSLHNGGIIRWRTSKTLLRPDWARGPSHAHYGASTLANVLAKNMSRN